MSALALLIKKNDINLFYLINKKIHCQLLNLFMKLITQLGSTAFAISLAAVFLIYNYIYSGKTGILLAVNLISSQILAQLIKRLVNRPRPYKTLAWAIAIKPPACQYSFPSGHTCAAFSIALTLMYSFPVFTALFLAAAVLVGISRIYLGCHYPTDVVIGFAIAFSVFMTVKHFALPMI